MLLYVVLLFVLVTFSFNSIIVLNNNSLLKQSSMIYWSCWFLFHNIQPDVCAKAKRSSQFHTELDQKLVYKQSTGFCSNNTQHGRAGSCNESNRSMLVCSAPELKPGLKK